MALKFDVPVVHHCEDPVRVEVLSMSLLTDDEVRILLLSLSRTRESFTDEEAAKVYEWAAQARLGATMLDLILSEWVDVGLSATGEIAYYAHGERSDFTIGGVDVSLIKNVSEAS